MINNNVIIASNAGFLVDTLCEKLKDVEFRVFTASTDNDLMLRIKKLYPRYIFLEQCFIDSGTDQYLYKIMKSYNDLHVVIWTASNITPTAAARFIHAGAESFFSLRDTGDNIEKILLRIAGGRRYCPDDVRTVLDSDFCIPIFDTPLTDKETQVIKLFGKSDKEIANVLSVSVHTVVYHKTNIYRKCGMKRKNEVLEYAVRKGIITSEE